MRRRWLLCTVATTAALAGCGAVSTNTNGNVTTITVNVAKLNAWGQAFVNGALLVGDLPGIAGTPAASALNAIGTALVGDLQGLADVAGTQTTLTFDQTSIPTAINSLLKDGQTLLTDAGAMLPEVVQAEVDTAQTYINAISTFVALLQAQLSPTVPVGAALKATPMTEAQAAKTLKVH